MLIDFSGDYAANRARQYRLHLVRQPHCHKFIVRLVLIGITSDDLLIQ